MMQLGFELVDGFAAVGLIVVVSIIAGGIRATVRAAEADKRRSARLAKLAESIDCDFSQQAVPTAVAAFRPFTWFIQGGEPYLVNTFDLTIKSRHGAAHVRLGDFRTVSRFQTREGEAEQIAQFSYALIDLPRRTGGRLLVRPQGCLDDVAERFGAEDIDFESASFNRRFLVRASSKRFAYEILHPGMIALLMDTEAAPVLIDEARCCITDASSRWTAELFRRKLDWIHKFLDTLPGHGPN